VLEKILEILKDADLRGLFFITGHMAEKLKSRVAEESLLSDE
jgi:peptidoglycan/xylan/chitin deacetylase (PgdA/CDA1 family)